MKNSFRVARIMGINIGIDPSWFIIFFLLVFDFGFLQFPRDLRPRSFLARPDTISITLGVAASLLLFASVLAHELSHAWMAIQRGIPVLGITLFIFGGVAQIADEPDKPSSEFLIAIMGPLMSAALAAMFGAAWVWLTIIQSLNLFNFSFSPLILLLGILAQANLALAVFNLAPGFPLDGGRVLRALLWRIWRDLRRATFWASRAGQLIAVIFVGVGAWQIFGERNLGGVWLGFIALFLWNAARQGYNQTVLRSTLEQVRVSDVMLTNPAIITPDLTLGEFVHHYLVHRSDPVFAVMDESGFLGLISDEHLKNIPRAEWQSRRVRATMTPRTGLNPLAPDDSAAVAVTRLARGNIAQLPVLEGESLVGIVSEGEISKFLRFG